jgi:ankyrin repeat protein
MPPPIVSSADLRDLELVELLLKAGADPNAQRHDGKTALMLVSESKSIWWTDYERVRALLKKYGAK